MVKLMISWNIWVPQKESDGDVLYFHFHDLLTTTNIGIENCHWKIISELDQLKD